MSKSHQGINVDKHSKPRKKRKHSILYSHLFRGFECRKEFQPQNLKSLLEYFCYFTVVSIIFKKKVLVKKLN
jgi:hypothetical protein